MSTETSSHIKAVFIDIQLQAEIQNAVASTQCVWLAGARNELDMKLSNIGWVLSILGNIENPNPKLNWESINHPMNFHFTRLQPTRGKYFRP